MMVIGANTPAMIKTMTREVESRNLIVASMHCARKALTPACRPASRSLHLPQADSLSHYTLDAMTGNACRQGLASAIRKKESAAGRQSPGTLFRLFTAACELPRHPAGICTIVTSSA
jgi:hypothetical protein